MKTIETERLIQEILAGAIRQEVNVFLVDRQSRGLSPNTIEYYSLELKYFCDFLDRRGVSLVSDIRPNDIRVYLIELAGHRNPGGVHSGFRTIRAFLNWWGNETEPVGWKNPISKVKPPKVASNPIPGAELDDIQKMINTCEDDPFGKRDRVLLMALVDTGCRATEFCSIRISDVDLKTGSIIIEHGKGDKRRVVYLGKKTLSELTRYLRKRQPRGNEPLFPNDEGKFLTRSGLAQLLTRRAKRANVDNPSPHDFRRACAISLLRNGADLISVQRILGHSSLTITAKYLAQVNGDLQATHARTSPVDHMKH